MRRPEGQNALIRGDCRTRDRPDPTTPDKVLLESLSVPCGIRPSPASWPPTKSPISDYLGRGGKIRRCVGRNQDPLLDQYARNQMLARNVRGTVSAFPKKMSVRPGG